MKIIISEKQYKFLKEQKKGFDYNTGAGSYYGTYGYDKEGKTTWTKLDQHTKNEILSFGTAFIPAVGPFISAGIGVLDAKQYLDEGDKTTAGLVAAFSMLPFVGSIPGVKQLGSKGMAALASKISKGGVNLTKAEAEIAIAVKNYRTQIQEELLKLAPKLKNLVKELDLHKGNYIKKYGQDGYNRLLIDYLYDVIDKESFIQKLRNVKNVNIRIKPIIGQGNDHRVFQSVTHPNQIFKVEARPGEIDKWYETFKKYPEVFVNTLRKTQIKDKSGQILQAVVQEKLNNKPFMELWDNVEKALFRTQKNLPPNQQVSSLEFLLKNLSKYPKFKTVWNNTLKYIDKEIPQISNKTNEFNKIVDGLYKITSFPDIRKYNLGYDASGLLKVLDF